MGGRSLNERAIAVHLNACDSRMCRHLQLHALATYAYRLEALDELRRMGTTASVCNSICARDLCMSKQCPHTVHDSAVPVLGIAGSR